VGMGLDDYAPHDAAALLQTIDTSTALIIPHQHPGGDWTGPDRDKMRLVEMYSHWGGFERPDGEPPFCMGKHRPGGSVSDALASGMRLGFVAGSDDHTGHPGNSFFWVFGDCPGGLTGVWATDLSTDSIWHALHDRACYATTRARILVKFTVNGAMMGSQIRLSSPGEPRRLEAEVHGTADIDEVCLIRNGETVFSETPGCLDVQVAFADEERLEGGDDCYYYLRVTQSDGEMAWASPVWVSA